MKKFIALGILVTVIAALKFLPWYISVGVVIGSVMLGKFLIGKIFMGAAKGLFEWKSKVLRGATVRLHGITNAPPPKRDEDWDDDEDDLLENEPRCYRYIDLTITPANAKGIGRRISEEEADAAEEATVADEPDEPDESAEGECAAGTTLWDPSDLALVAADTKQGMSVDDADDLGDVYDVAIYDDGNWVPLEGEKLLGAHRLRLHVGVKPNVDEFKVKYYFEVLKNAGSDC